MNIIGIFNAHNSSVSLVKNGNVIYAAAEERFNREKFTRKFPSNAIENCLQYTQTKPEDIDLIAYGGYCKPNVDSVIDFIRTAAAYNPIKSAERLQNSLSVDYGFISDFHYNIQDFFPKTSISYYDHHYSHACLAFYTSPFYCTDSFASSNIYIITADGRGDLQSSVIWKVIENKIYRIKTFCELKSLGFMYGQITSLLGFKAHKHEGKVTGLAAFGKYTDLVDELSELISYYDRDIQISSKYMPFNAPNDMSHLIQITQKYQPADIAYAVQYVLEDILLSMISDYIPMGSIVCLAGGIFGNVKLNQKIREHNHIQNYYIAPEMGDGGISLGSAIAACIDNGISNIRCEDMYLGPKFEWKDIDTNQFEIRKFDSDNDAVGMCVDLLINKSIVGLYCSNMEFGPRALGARTILAETTDFLINDKLNKRLNRTEFMPFAPVTLEEEASNMYIGWTKEDTNTNFMTTCYTCTDKMKQLSPAVVHIDNTARPQIINQNHPIKLYYQILKKYHHKTGIPNLINTSFNNHEEPIVCSPNDALNSLLNNNIDYILTDSLILIRKK